MALMDKNSYRIFLENIFFLKEKISERSAYLGVILGFIVFTFSLFLPWAKARTTLDVIDSGASTGWAESGYIAAIPLLFILYKVLKNKNTNISSALILFLVAIIIVIFNNVVSRSTWVTQTHCSDGDCNFGSNFGSDLGSGFWIGLIAIVVIGTCGVSWAFHKSDYRKT